MVIVMMMIIKMKVKMIMVMMMMIKMMIVMLMKIKIMVVKMMMVIVMIMKMVMVILMINLLPLRDLFSWSQENSTIEHKEGVLADELMHWCSLYNEA